MSSGGAVLQYNVMKWIEENKEYFLPPVCNKLMHSDGQCKVMFVGGPNQRKDYHIEYGEELFLQVRGDLVIKVREKGQHKDIVVREGEMFLLPAGIPHSPQRTENTVGLVIERERAKTELDALRFFVEDDHGNKLADVLFEKWFYCNDLGTALPPLISEFLGSEAFKTGVAAPGSIPTTRPLVDNVHVVLPKPVHFRKWIDDHTDVINAQGRLAVFDCDVHQFQVYVYGAGEIEDYVDLAETWIWQLQGSSDVTYNNRKYNLDENDSLLVAAAQRFTVKQDKGSLALVVWQDPAKAGRY